MKKKVVWKGKSAFVVMGTVVVIWAMEEGIGLVRCAWLVNQADVVVA